MGMQLCAVFLFLIFSGQDAALRTDLRLSGSCCAEVGEQVQVSAVARLVQRVSHRVRRSWLSRADAQISPYAWCAVRA